LELNTPALDGCPILSPDGLSLYLASDRPGGLGKLDIWVARRASRSAPFGAPVNLGAPVNSPEDDFCPSPMAGNCFLFVSTRAGGCGSADIYLTRPVGEHGWWQPLHLGCHVNSPGQEASPYLLTHKESGRALLYFSSNRPGGFAADPDPRAPDADLYVSQLTLFGFGPARLVPGLNSERNDARPNLRPDGLEIVFDSDRPGTLGGQDI
jgi:WD40 repeat protein